ncbi:cholinesterase-like [Panonychus citri]|uniref:cholinesterase-like n=1 Tax=Panonychus citri TaxID=50023 RepID=UPI002307ACC7|nr:cholinesterase-like [Panonychus citri]
MFCLIVKFTLIVLIIERTEGERQPLIKTDSCIYKGSSEQINGVTLYSWKGIRYGQPPIGNLRFKPPQPFICSKDQVIEATNAANICPQVVPESLMINVNQLRNGINMSEDCLQLNVWVPLLSDEQLIKSLPFRTLVILPGGNYEANLLIDQNFNDGSVLAARGGIIVITLQYRLGVLGFTYTDNPEAPGNQGLMDQSLALQWVKSNIAFFGGDPSLVTIYGQGSGSTSSVIVNILNSDNQPGNPFNRFILSSGFPVHGSCDDKATAFQRFIWFTEEVGCRPPSSYSIETSFILTCLRSLPLESILKGQLSLGQHFSAASPGLFQVPTKPTAGTDNFNRCTFDPKDYASSSFSYRGLNIIMLNMQDEGSTYLLPEQSVKGLAPSPTGDDILNYFKFIDNQTSLYMGLQVESLENILPLYFAEVLDGYEMGLKEALVQFIGDRLVYCPSLLSGLALASSGNYVHQGLITYTSSENLRDYIPANYGDIFDSTYGTRTGLDYWLIMGKPFVDPMSSDQDKWMSNELIRLVSDFVKTEEIPWPSLLPLSTGRVVPFEYDLDIKKSYRPLRKSDRYFDCKSWKPFIWPANSSPIKSPSSGYGYS